MGKPSLGEFVKQLEHDPSDRRRTVRHAISKAGKPLPADTEVQDYRRATFYLRADQLKALKIKAVEADRDYSEVVREAVDEWLKRHP